ncbi:MAG: metallophosphoesterase [Pirellulales bacterium]|nr:metallophosphoesterase [Pirellulales bacterium]
MSNNKLTYFVSDLHMYSSRSQEERYLEEIERKAARANNFVLGGDIFDFRWSTMDTHEETVVQAVDWLRQLVTDCPNCAFYYVLGNHDYNHDMMDGCERLAEKFENFAWNPFYVRLGDSVFLHGDAADRVATGEELAEARERWLWKEKRGQMANRLYDIAVANRLHMPVVRLARTKKTTARRILSYLRSIDEGPSSGVRNVYFGHTHLAFSDYRYGGLIFHNGGAPMEGLHFEIIRAEL